MSEYFISEHRTPHDSLNMKKALGDNTARYMAV